MSDEPLVTCVYGWGRNVRLYWDRLEADGRSYWLYELTDLQAHYSRLFGVTSARLVATFDKQKIVMRGISELAAAQSIETYLRTRLYEMFPYYIPPLLPAPTHQETPRPQMEIPTSEFWVYDDLQNQKSTHHEAGIEHPGELYDNFMDAPTEEQIPDVGEVHQESFEEPISEIADKQTIIMPRLEMGVDEPPPISTGELRQQDQQERRRSRLRRLRTERICREHGFDVHALTMRLRSGALIPIDVPVKLSNDEIAYYQIEATLCGEPYGSRSIGGIRQHSGYRVKDQGLLVLTNRRILYLGRLRQISLEYESLREVTRNRRFICVSSDEQKKIQHFEVRRPLEVTMYLECILQRYVQPTLSDHEGEVLYTIPTTPTENWERLYEHENLYRQEKAVR